MVVFHPLVPLVQVALAKSKASQKATLSVLPGVSLGSVAQRVDISPVVWNGGGPAVRKKWGQKKLYIGNLYTKSICSANICKQMQTWYLFMTSIYEIYFKQRKLSQSLSESWWWMNMGIPKSPPTSPNCPTDRCPVKDRTSMSYIWLRKSPKTAPLSPKKKRGSWVISREFDGT